MTVRQPKLSLYSRQRIKCLLSEGKSTREVVEELQKENIFTSRQTVWRFERHIRLHGTINPLSKSGRPTKLTPLVLQQIDNAMTRDDETTAKELQLVAASNRTSVCVKTVLKGRRLLGWTRRGTAYCQMIRERNRAKRLEWAHSNLGTTFEDVIWTDETLVQMESHRRFHCYKKGLKPRYKPRPKHPVKVHVWAGISWRGPTSLCVFDGIMDAPMYTSILEEHLVPFIRNIYRSGHRLMQDNDPKHTSRHAKEFFLQNSIKWWQTPPESPDANPIENLWHKLKEYIRRVIKPRTKEELVNGILCFWATVTTSKCQRYILHLNKVIPEIIRVNGEATGFCFKHC